MVVIHKNTRKGSVFAHLKSLCAGFFFAVFLIIISASSAFAAADVSDISENIVTSVEGLPGFVAALSYLLGILLGALGILKIKEHVDNPSQTPIRVGFVRLIAGGALFGLPIIYEAVGNLFCRRFYRCK